MHGVRRVAAGSSGRSGGASLWQVPLPWPCTNDDYESRMAEACRRAVAEGFDAIAFGDLFLRDVRAYRERQLAGSGLTPLFPLWELPTAALAREMIAGGLRARLSCVDSKALDRAFAGREFDDALLADLPATADPCGENGEFHTFVYDGPMFRAPHRDRSAARFATSTASSTRTSWGRRATYRLADRQRHRDRRRPGRSSTHLVGRSHECDYPEAVLRLPVCTRPAHSGGRQQPRNRPAGESRRRATSVSIYDVFDDVLERLEPTHILTQIQCEVCAVSLRDVEQAIARGMKGNPRIVSLQPDSLAQIWEDFRRVAARARHRGSAAKRWSRHCRPVCGTRRVRAAGTAPRVACIEWMEPLMAAGNWTPELIEMAGGSESLRRGRQALAVDDLGRTARRRSRT